MRRTHSFGPSSIGHHAARFVSQQLGGSVRRVLFDQLPDRRVDLIELLLNLRLADELDLELLPDLGELILHHRKDVAALHLWSGWPDWSHRSGRTYVACLAGFPRCATSPACSGSPRNPRTAFGMLDSATNDVSDIQTGPVAKCVNSPIAGGR